MRYGELGLFALALAAASGCKARISEQSAVFSTTAECKSAPSTSADPKTLERRPVESSTYYKALDDGDAHKQAVVVYYAVDTKENYFQATLAYELAQLRTACDGSPAAKHVNFVFWANSLLFGPEPRFYQCRGGKLSAQRLQAHPRLAKRLGDQRACIGKDAEKFANCAAVLEMPVPFGKEAGATFQEHALSHPGVFLTVMRYTQELFPLDRYVEFWHLKSHGSPKLFLTGLDENQVSQKNKCQDSLMKLRLAALNQDAKVKHDEKEIVWPEWGTVGLKPVKTYGLAITLAGLGASGNGKGLGNLPDDLRDKEGALGTNGNPDLGTNGNPDLGTNGNPDLGTNGNPDLGTNGNPDLGTNGNPDLGIHGNDDLGIDGNPDLGVEGGAELGASEASGSLGTGGLGLRADNQFGLAHVSLAASLVELGVDGENVTPLGFLFAESCDSRMAERSTLTQAFQDLKGLDGYFSASGSLFYRNLDYKDLLHEWSAAGGGARNLQVRIIRAARKVKAYVYE